MLKFIFFFLMAGACADTSYEVYSIPFDVQFYTGTKASDVEKRSWGKKQLSSKSIDVLMKSISSSCNGSLPPIIDYRVKIKSTDGKILLIDRQKRFTTLMAGCTFEEPTKNAALKELNIQLAEINKKSGSEVINEKENDLKGRPTKVNIKNNTNKSWP